MAGGRPTPPHVHSYEEEIFFVLAGGGFSWQDGATYEVRPGDCLAHRPGRGAHTLIAGSDGLDVLAFGERPTTEATVVPRAGTAWLGPTWAAVGDEPHPWARDAAAGPLAVPEPSERPASIVGVDDAPTVPVVQGGSELTCRLLTTASGLVRTGLQHVTLAPGKIGWPPHAHSMQEEIFVVLDGGGWLELYQSKRRAGASAWDPTPEAQQYPLRRGSVVSRPAGSGAAHAFRAGDAGLTYLAYGTRDPGDVTWYPRSRKVMFQGLLLVGRLEITDYWDGER